MKIYHAATTLTLLFVLMMPIPINAQAQCDEDNSDNIGGLGCMGPADPNNTTGNNGTKSSFNEMVEPFFPQFQIEVLNGDVDEAEILEVFHILRSRYGLCGYRSVEISGEPEGGIVALVVSVDLPTRSVSEVILQEETPQSEEDSFLSRCVRRKIQGLFFHWLDASNVEGDEVRFELLVSFEEAADEQ